MDLYDIAIAKKLSGSGGGGGGSSDFSTVTVTLIRDSEDPAGGGQLNNASIIYDGQIIGYDQLVFSSSADETVELVLYKGSFVSSVAAMGLSASGDIVLTNTEVIDGWTFADCVITGDCTIHYIANNPTTPLQ